MDRDNFIKKRYDTIRDKFIKNLVYDNTKTPFQVIDILKDALYYNVRNDVVDKYIVLGERISDKKPHVSQMKNIGGELKKLNKYKFLVIGGAMLYNKTVYHKTHKEAWEEINRFVENDRSGNILSVVAYELNGETTRALEGLENMFKEPTEGVRAAVVKDFIPNYEYNPCECRKKKLERIEKD